MSYKLHIDNLYFSVNVDNYRTYDYEIMKIMGIKTEGGGTVNLKELLFEVKPRRWENYDLWLSNEYFELMFDSSWEGTEDHFPIYIQCHSKGLLECGTQGLYETIISFLEQFGCKVLTTKLSRLDIAADTDQLQLTEKSLDNFIRRSKKWEWIHDIKLVDHDERFNAYGLASIFTGFAFGKRGGSGVYCRVYNKSVEIKKHEKEYMVEAWKSWGFINLENVWRIEFELHRDRLRELGLDRAKDVFDERTNMLWHYLTTEYIRLVKKKLKNNIQLSPVHEAWQELQKLRFEFKGKVEFANRNQGKREALKNLLVGSLTSLAAYEGLYHYDDVIDLVKESLEEVLTNRFLAVTENVNRDRDNIGKHKDVKYYFSKGDLLKEVIKEKCEKNLKEVPYLLQKKMSQMAPIQI